MSFVNLFSRQHGLGVVLLEIGNGAYWMHDGSESMYVQIGIMKREGGKWEAMLHIAYFAQKTKN